MPGRQALRSYPPARFELGDTKHPVSEEHSSGQNQRLAMLPEADCERLLPAREHVALPPGQRMYRAGAQQGPLHFMTAGLVSRCYLIASGASAGFAVAGSEGVVGVASFLGGESMPSEAVVLSAGHAYRLGGVLLRREFERGGPLRRLSLRYTHALIVQIGRGWHATGTTRWSSSCAAGCC